MVENQKQTKLLTGGNSMMTSQVLCVERGSWLLMQAAGKFMQSLLLEVAEMDQMLRRKTEKQLSSDWEFYQNHCTIHDI